MAVNSQKSERVGIVGQVAYSAGLTGCVGEGSKTAPCPTNGSSNRDRGLDARVALVVAYLEVFKLVVKDRVGATFDVQRGGGEG